ncbi:MAG: DNA primase [Ruminiclostridium sp.]|nr:DNA primase [Ruminiclostridium sp.]
MARFSDSFLEALKANNEITSVMSSYVELKRAGRDFVCSCPFHAEKTPSCHVYTGTQSFYCFGCHAGGDVISFIRLIEHLEYPESVRFLAQRAGMPMPEDAGSDDASKRRTRMLEMNRDAARYFRDVLNSEAGREGMDYLNERRLERGTMIRYGLGYAPNDWHSLHFHLRRLGYTDDEMADAALVVRNKKSVYDKFRHRVMFPIIDRRGNVIAFGGRALEKDAPAKYLNSDETLVFHKRESLFSLNFAKNTKEKFLILCEGYMDVIMLNQAGFDSAVATLGTAITPQQVQIMKQYAPEVIISYDSDSAGQNAAMKAINLLSEAGVASRVLVIPDAKDPDEYIKKFGAESFRQLLGKTATALDHEFGRLKAGIDLTAAAGRAEFLKKAVPFLASISTDTDRAVYISETAKISEQPVNVITDLVNERRRKNSAGERRAEERELIHSKITRDPINPDSVNYPREERAERGIIAYMFNSPDLLPRVEKKLTPEDFPTAFNRKVFVCVSERIKNGGTLDMGSIGAEFSADEVGRITGICRQADKLPYSIPQLDEYINVLVACRTRREDKPASEMSDEELLRKMDELRNKKKKQ